MVFYLNFIYFRCSYLLLLSGVKEMDKENSGGVEDPGEGFTWLIDSLFFSSILML